MSIEPLQDKIQQYLDKELSAEACADFERQIAESLDLAEEINRFRQFRIMKKHADLFEARIQLSAIMAETPIQPDYGVYESHFKPPFGQRSMVRWFMGGLSLLILVGGVLVFQQSQKSKFLRELARNYAQPMENIIGFHDSDTSWAAKGMRAYKQHDYSQTIMWLQKALNAAPEDNNLKLYLAIACLMQKQPRIAEQWFRQIIVTDNLVTIPAKFYLAISLLEQNNVTESLEYLRNIVDDATFGAQAKAILTKLN